MYRYLSCVPITKPATNIYVTNDIARNSKGIYLINEMNTYLLFLIFNNMFEQ